MVRYMTSASVALGSAITLESSTATTNTPSAAGAVGPRAHGLHERREHPPALYRLTARRPVPASRAARSLT